MDNKFNDFINDILLNLIKNNATKQYITYLE